MSPVIFPHDPVPQHQMHHSPPQFITICPPHNTIRIPPASLGTPEGAYPEVVPWIAMTTVKVVLTVAATLDTVLKCCAKWAGNGGWGSWWCSQGMWGSCSSVFIAGIEGRFTHNSDLPLLLTCGKAGKWVKIWETTYYMARGTCLLVVGTCLWLLFPLPGVHASHNHQALFSMVLDTEISYSPSISQFKGLPPALRETEFTIGSFALLPHPCRWLPCSSNTLIDAHLWVWTPA